MRGWVGWREAPKESGLPMLAASGLLVLVGLLLLRADRAVVGAVELVVRAGERVPDRLLLLCAAGLGAAFWLSEGLVVSAATGAGLAALAVATPQWVLALVLASLPFFLVPKTVLGMPLSVPEALAWLVLVGSLLRAWALSGRPFSRVRLQSLDMGVGLLLAAAVASTAAAPNAGVAWHDLRRVVVSAAALYVAVRLTGRRAVWPAVIGVLAGAAVASSVGIRQYLQGENLISAGEVARVRAWYGSPNNLALYLGRAIPLALGLALFGPRRPVRAAAALSFLVCLICGVLTRSRGLILLGLPLSTAWLLWQTGRLRRARGLLVALAAAVVLVAAVLVGGRVEQLLTGQDAAAGMRLHVWAGAVNMIRDHPLLGVGPDNFLYLYRTHYILPAAWAEPNLSHPHNVLLDFWLSAGLLGVVALVVLIGAGLYRGLQAIRVHRGERAVYLGVCAALLAALVQGLVDNSFFLVDLSHITLAYLAILANAPGEAPRAGPTRANSSMEQTT